MERAGRARSEPPLKEAVVETSPERSFLGHSLSLSHVGSARCRRRGSRGSGPGAPSTPPREQPAPTTRPTSPDAAPRRRPTSPSNHSPACPRPLAILLVLILQRSTQ
ncbi:hypothetical protein BT93_C2385 [Corymbia citriodora subsp. variegata]|nr:hypothetical protein BT93_C2385 [Corymbia citriodora subsp. variegata]